ncbi:hypothetical protein [Mycolicibacterium sp. SCSIO 43805]|uniref:hypothetical protein n=1 Tax=Mycolicibacterium sp. SCSIO 43805 TaxID=3378074 RepID=UPI003AB16EFA
MPSHATVPGRSAALSARAIPSATRSIGPPSGPLSGDEEGTRRLSFSGSVAPTTSSTGLSIRTVRYNASSTSSSVIVTSVVGHIGMAGTCPVRADLKRDATFVCRPPTTGAIVVRWGWIG